MTQEIFQIDNKALADDHARSLISKLSNSVSNVESNQVDLETQVDKNSSDIEVLKNNKTVADVDVSNIIELNRNLYDSTKGEDGKTLTINTAANTYTISAATNVCVSEKMPVIAGETYVTSQTFQRIVFLDANEFMVGYLNAAQFAWTDIAIPENATHAIMALTETGVIRQKMNFGLKSQLQKLNYGVVFYPPNEARLSKIYPTSNLEGKKCVWMGTSIPWGGGHPEFACGALGMQLTNVAQGFNRIRAFNSNGTYAPQNLLIKMFTLTKEDVNARYSAMLGKTVKTTDYLVEDASGVVLTQEMLDALTEWSFESKVEPIIADNDVFVLEFAVNDVHGQVGDFEFAKDSGLDRSKYAGAHNYVINKILTQKPDARIILVGHFSSDDSVYASASKFVDAQRDIAEYWNLPLVDLASVCGVNSLTKSLTRLSDGIHFDAGTTLGIRVANHIVHKFAEIGA